MVNTTPAFTGGALSFKGDKKKKKKKAKKKKQSLTKHQVVNHADTLIEQQEQQEQDDNNNEMTDAEKKAYKKKQERELQELTMVAQKSHRERIEEFNSKLNELTELNDIPRVSAAGNG